MITYYKTLQSSYLNNTLEGLVTFLICSSFLQVFTNANIFPEKNFPVFFQPIEHLNYSLTSDTAPVSTLITDLLDILLEQSECQPLVELDLLGVPLGLELPVVGEDLVDDGEDVAGALLVIGRRVN